MADKPQEPGVEYRAMVGYPSYLVGDDGSVWTNKHFPKGCTIVNGWRRLNPSSPDRYGHRTVTLSTGIPGKLNRRRIQPHTLVLAALVGPRPEMMEGCHNDGDPSNNRLDNLRWDTHKNNAADMLRHGNGQCGTKQWMSKLDDGKVQEIRARFAAGGISCSALGRTYSISRKVIELVVKRRIWKHVPDLIDPPTETYIAMNATGMREKDKTVRGSDHHRSKLDDEKVREIRRRYAAGETQRSIFKDAGVSQSAISAIVNGKAWKHVAD